MRRNILMVVTSHDRIDADHPTGIWFEEFAIPWNLFREAGHAITVASPRGGAAPVDPRSLEDLDNSDANRLAQEELQATAKLSTNHRAEDYDAIFFPGGHGTMYDLPDNPDVQRLVREMDAAGKPVAAVCHGPSCLVNVVRADGSFLVTGREITAFTNSEEQAVQLDKVMPFLLESRLRELGGNFKKADDWADNTIADGNLVTGQNPQSSGSAARRVLELLE